MGQGRNSVYLATLGWEVTGMDPAEVGLAIARQSAHQAKVRITPILQTAEEFDWGEARWDLIAVIYMNPRRLKEQIRASLKPGGLLVVEGFHRDATKDRKIGAGVVYDTDESRNMLPEFEVLRYQEPEALPDFGPEKVPPRPAGRGGRNADRSRLQARRPPGTSYNPGLISTRGRSPLFRLTDPRSGRCPRHVASRRPFSYDKIPIGQLTLSSIGS